MIPTYCLRGDLKDVFDRHLGADTTRGSFEKLDEGAVAALQKKMSEYRTTPEILSKLESVFSVYKGTKKYHNYTNKLSYTDGSSSRYMMDFSPVKSGVIYGPDGMEWIGVR